MGSVEIEESRGIVWNIRLQRGPECHIKHVTFTLKAMGSP